MKEGSEIFVQAWEVCFRALTSIYLAPSDKYRGGSREEGGKNYSTIPIAFSEFFYYACNFGYEHRLIAHLYCLKYFSMLRKRSYSHIYRRKDGEVVLRRGDEQHMEISGVEVEGKEGERLTSTDRSFFHRC